MGTSPGASNQLVSASAPPAFTQKLKWLFWPFGRYRQKKPPPKPSMLPTVVVSV